MTYHSESVVDQNTGEVISSPAQSHTKSPVGSADRLQELLCAALERNAQADQRLASAHANIERLQAQVVALRKTVNEKRQHFHNQLAEAQGRFRSIVANSSASYPTKKGGEVHIDYANLGAMLDSVRPVLTELGISYRQPVLDHPEDRAMTTVQTVLACDGYEEIVSSFSFSSQAKLGGDFKELGTAITYVRRYTLAASLGLAIDASKESSARFSGRPSTQQSRPQARPGPSQQQQASTQPGAQPRVAASAQHQASVQSSPPPGAPGVGSNVDEIEQKLRTLSFAEVVQVFNALDGESKRHYKALFDERRNHHQNQTRRAA